MVYYCLDVKFSGADFRTLRTLHVSQIDNVDALRAASGCGVDWIQFASSLGTDNQHGIHKCFSTYFLHGQLTLLME